VVAQDSEAASADHLLNHMAADLEVLLLQLLTVEALLLLMEVALVVDMAVPMVTHLEAAAANLGGKSTFDGAALFLFHSLGFVTAP